MQARAVDFIGVAVPDMEKARQFYGETLSLAPAAGFGDGWQEYDIGNITIALIKVPEEEIVGGSESGWKNGVVALAVADVAATLSELREKGVPVVWETSEHPPCFMAMVEDPFGNRVALHQRKDGTAG